MTNFLVVVVENSDRTLKSLIDNNYKSIYGTVRNKCSSCGVPHKM